MLVTQDGWTVVANISVWQQIRDPNSTTIAGRNRASHFEMTWAACCTDVQQNGPVLIVELITRKNATTYRQWNREREPSGNRWSGVILSGHLFSTLTGEV
jgi:hypothetical protein